MQLPLAWEELPAESDIFSLIPEHTGFGPQSQDYKADFATTDDNSLPGAIW